MRKSFESVTKVRIKHWLSQHKFRIIKESNSANAEWVFVCDDCDLVQKVNYWASGHTDTQYFLDAKLKQIKVVDSTWQGDNYD